MAHLLLIEDDQTLRRALCVSLEKMGHTVVETGDGRQALSAFKKQPADLIVTDLIMPGMEGVETIRELKKMNPRVPIIAISGGGRGSPAGYLQIAQSFGADKIYAKPFDIGALCQSVEELLGNIGGSTQAERDDRGPS